LLAWLIEVDDTYVGGPKPGKRRRRARGKFNVVVAVKTPGDKPQSAAILQVPKVGAAEVEGVVRKCLKEEALSLTDGWRTYRVIASLP
jgi:hypothetical protein